MRTRTRTPIVPGLLFLAVAACGDRHALPLDGSPDGPARVDGTQPRPDSKTPLKLDQGGGTFTYRGRVFLGQATDPRMNMPGWVETRVGFATVFYEAMFGPTTTEGACSFGQMLPPPPAVTNFVDAGAVTVSGGLQPLPFKFSSTDYYTVSLAPGTYELFKPGQTLGVSAAGSTLPAFTGAVPAPDPLKVKTPDLYQMSTTIDTSKDYLVTWTHSSADRVRVVISCPGPEGEFRVECDSHDGGQLTLPSVVLAALAPRCTASKMAQADFIRLNERHVEQGDVRVTLRASSLIRGGLVFK